MTGGPEHNVRNWPELLDLGRFSGAGPGRPERRSFLARCLWDGCCHRIAVVTKSATGSRAGLTVARPRLGRLIGFISATGRSTAAASSRRQTRPSSARCRSQSTEPCFRTGSGAIASIAGISIGSSTWPGRAADPGLLAAAAALTRPPGPSRHLRRRRQAGAVCARSAEATPAARRAGWRGIAATTCPFFRTLATSSPMARSRSVTMSRP